MKIFVFRTPGVHRFEVRSGPFVIKEGKSGRSQSKSPKMLLLYSAFCRRFIKAATFLEGFHEPALAVLYEPIQTCPGRLASKRSTCQLALLSLNLTQVRTMFVFCRANIKVAVAFLLTAS